MLAIQVMQQILKDARMRDAPTRFVPKCFNLATTRPAARAACSSCRSILPTANEDVRQILISGRQDRKRAGRIEELDFSKTETPARNPRLVSPRGELFPLPRKLRAGE